MHNQHQVNQVSERKLFGLRLIKRFNKSEDGVAAIEFGMLALPFLMLVFAILETALGFFAAQVFESGVDSVGREIRTGQINSTSTTAAQVRTKICEKTWSLFDCNAIQIDVNTYAVFPSTPLTTPRNGAGNFDNTGLQYDTGVAGSIVIVRAYYEWPIILDYLWQNVSGLSNGARLFVATTAFQNEPFGAT